MKNETGAHQTLGYIWWSQLAFLISLYLDVPLSRAAGVGASIGCGLLVLNLLLAVGAALARKE